MFFCNHWLEFYLFSTEHSQDLCQILCAGAADVFEHLQVTTSHERVEIVYSVFFPGLVVNFQTFLEQLFGQFGLFWFPIKNRHCCFEGLVQCGYSVDVVVEIGRITVTCQLLKSQQNQVCFNCLSGILNSKLWLTCGAHVLLFSWRSARLDKWPNTLALYLQESAAALCRLLANPQNVSRKWTFGAFRTHDTEKPMAFWGRLAKPTQHRVDKVTLF